MYINAGHYVSKALRSGLTMSDLREMSAVEVFEIIRCSEGLDAIDKIDQLRIVANPSLLKSEKGAARYADIFKEFEKIKNNKAYKTVTIKADLSKIMALKAMIEGSVMN